MDPFLDILGKRIRARRRLLGVSQEFLAHESGLDRSYVGRVERGENNLTVMSLIKICRALHCDIAALGSDLPPVRSSDRVEANDLRAEEGSRNSTDAQNP